MTLMLLSTRSGCVVSASLVSARAWCLRTGTEEGNTKKSKKKKQTDESSTQVAPPVSVGTPQGDVEMHTAIDIEAANPVKAIEFCPILLRHPM